LKTITVTVAKDGSTKVETRGFAGASCQSASEFLEKALGTRQTEVLTSEFYVQQQVPQRVQEGQV
jgi:hypothetical protein